MIDNKACNCCFDSELETITREITIIIVEKKRIVWYNNYT